MKRISIWALSTLSAVVLLFSYSTSTSGPLAVAGGSTTALPVVSSGGSASSGTSTTTTSGSGGTGGGSGTGTTSTTAKKVTTTRTVTGDVASTQWGPVQVQLVTVNGRIARVAVLQYPNGNGKDAEINSYALPILTKETISAQNASIDMVSGATVTSGGYLQSLQSALDKAKL